MKLLKILAVCGLVSGMCADNTAPSRVEIEKELVDAEKEFQEVKQMFNPWYTGPLLAPSAHIISPGDVNIQPYIFFTGNYGRYSDSGHVQSSQNLFQIYPTIPTLVGLLDWMELIVTVQGYYNKKGSQSSFNIGDFPIGFGFKVLQETPYIPAISIAIKETFPTGKYQKLNPEKNGVDSMGMGSYQTNFYLNFSKLVWWWSYAHPMAFRLSIEYTLPSHVHVKGFNAYGGGYGTDGTVKPGQSISADFGYEFSFNRHWVAALDVVYNYTTKTTFSGNDGTTSSGTAASVGGPFNDQLSLAPGLEYNWSDNLGVIAGFWFTVWGRNSTAFASGILSVSWTF